MRKLASPWTRTLQAISILLLAGCSTYRPWINEPYPHQPREVLAAEQHQPKSVMVAVTLSGGGARAAAFGLGVLRELKAQEFKIGERTTTLLDETVLISGVSGGSILAAHYAAFGDATLVVADVALGREWEADQSLPHLDADQMREEGKDSVLFARTHEYAWRQRRARARRARCRRCRARPSAPWGTGSGKLAMGQAHKGWWGARGLPAALNEGSPTPQTCSAAWLASGASLSARSSAPPCRTLGAAAAARAASASASALVMAQP